MTADAMNTRSTRLQQLFANGAGLLQTGKPGEALACFVEARGQDPANAVLCLYTGTALHELHRYEEALTVYRTGLLSAPTMGELHNNLGNSLMACGRFAEAADCFQKAAEFLDSSPVPLAALATSLQATGKIAEAEAACRRALQRDPGCAAAHWNLALNLLLQGRYAEGWPEYEWRWKKPGFTSPIRHADIPLWDGSDLQGKTIVLHAEQGFGDAIQFVRYVPLVVQKGGAVILECHPQLVQIFKGLPGVQAVIPFGTELPPVSFQAPLLSLPHIFGTTLETIPSECPYLSVTPEYRNKWTGLMSGYPATLRVGLVWAGKGYPDPLRSSCLSDFAPLATLAEALFFSLQIGPGAEQAVNPPPALSLVDLTNHIKDFADTAALIDQLDLVISIDTSVAHLAGALGKPTVLLLPVAPDWRWMMRKSRSRWYPTMSIHRQRLAGQWRSVLEDVSCLYAGEQASSVTASLDQLLQLGFNAVAQGNHAGATAFFHRAQLLAPTLPDLFCGLAQAETLRENFEDAIDLYHLALERDPSYFQCRLGLGMILQKLDCLSDAEKCYRGALEINPEYVQAWNNLGTVLRAMGRFEEALKAYSMALKLAPDNADTHFNRALALLHMGDFEEGWRQYEWRFSKSDPVAQRHTAIPRWTSQLLQGKSLLLHAEQGYGDTIQFIRYAPIVSALGARVVVEAQDRSIASILQNVAGVAAVYVRGEVVETVDYQIPLMSIPAAMATRLDSIPTPEGYIFASGIKTDIWQELLNRDQKMKRVGVCWAGRLEYGADRQRSIPFETFSTLFNSEEVAWYSLQIGNRSGYHQRLKDVTELIHDFSDSAALICALDLVITVDTAVAHLAGALGKPVWLLLPYSSDWRWLFNRIDSPWYCSMRIFRQKQPGDWVEVICQVCRELNMWPQQTKNPLGSTQRIHVARK